jgi:hypothetical protein
MDEEHHSSLPGILEGIKQTSPSLPEVGLPSAVLKRKQYLMKSSHFYLIRARYRIRHAVEKAKDPQSLQKKLSSLERVSWLMYQLMYRCDACARSSKYCDPQMPGIKPIFRNCYPWLMVELAA